MPSVDDIPDSCLVAHGDDQLAATKPPADAVPRAPGPRPLVKRLITLWLVFHLVGIIVAPASVAPASRLFNKAWELYQPYLQVLYLNHGYHYFSPEPTESTLLGYVIERPDGTEIRGRIPDRRIEPRLLYHRHFMLTEFMNALPAEHRANWHRAYARHLAHKFGAARVSLSQITHYLPPMDVVRQGASLDEPQSYAEQPLGMFECDDLLSP